MIPCALRRLIAVSVLTLAAALSLGRVSAAGGSILIDQVSSSGVAVGSWILTRPDGSTINGSGLSKFIGENIMPGGYSLEISPPDSRTTSVHVVEDGQLIKSAVSTTVNFTITGLDSVTVNVAYGPFGDVTIDSKPRGASIELISSNFPRLTTHTPLVLNDVPPAQYRVQFGDMKGCTHPKHQDRQLISRSKLAFYGTYDCATPIDTREVGAPEVNQIFNRQLRVSQMTNQTEVLPGSQMTLSIGVRNLSRSTERDLVLSLAYDPSVITLPFVLPRGGKISGNLITWDIPELLATQSWTVELPVTVRSDVDSGHYIVSTARVGGNNLHESVMAHDIVSRAEITVLTSLPQTGVRFDILFAVMAVASAFFMTSSIRRKAIVGQTAS